MKPINLSDPEHILILLKHLINEVQNNDSNGVRGHTMTYYPIDNDFHDQLVPLEGAREQHGDVKIPYYVQGAKKNTMWGDFVYFLSKKGFKPVFYYWPNKEQWSIKIENFGYFINTENWVISENNLDYEFKKFLLDNRILPSEENERSPELVDTPKSPIASYIAVIIFLALLIILLLNL